MARAADRDRRRARRLFVAVLSAGALLAACSGSDDGGGAAATPIVAGATPTTVAPATAAPVAATTAAAPATVPAAATATPTTSAPAAPATSAPRNPDEAAEQQPDQPLDAATQATLDGQLAAAREVALRYPTVADARRAGFVLAGGFAPETGAHYINFISSGAAGFDPSHPGTLIYAGTDPTSPIAGLMYTSLGTNAPPDGFAGPNDHWHRHFNVCVRYGAGAIQIPFAVDRDVTSDQCSAVGGNFMPTTFWMVHAWVVPNWASPLGVFSHENPDLRCADGTTNADAVGFCTGISGA